MGMCRCNIFVYRFLTSLILLPSSATGENETTITNFQFIFSPTFPSWFNYVRYILGVIHTLLSFWMAIQYFAKNAPQFNWRISFLQQWMYVILTTSTTPVCLNLQCFQHILLLRYDFKRGVLRRKWLYHILNKCNWLEIKKPKREMYFEISFFDFVTLYRIVFVMCSVLGLFRPYFYCVCMIYVFIDNKDLHNVLRAISGGGKPCTYLVFVFIHCTCLGHTGFALSLCICCAVEVSVINLF